MVGVGVGSGTLAPFLRAEYIVRVRVRVRSVFVAGNETQSEI